MSYASLGVGYPPMSTNGGSSSSVGHRFVPHNFQYNGRVALALLPSLGVSAGLQAPPPLLGAVPAARGTAAATAQHAVATASAALLFTPRVRSSGWAAGCCMC